MGVRIKHSAKTALRIMNTLEGGAGIAKISEESAVEFYFGQHYLEQKISGTLQLDVPLGHRDYGMYAEVTGFHLHEILGLVLFSR